MNEKLFIKIAGCKICATVLKTQKFVNDCYRKQANLGIYTQRHSID